MSSSDQLLARTGAAFWNFGNLVVNLYHTTHFKGSLIRFPGNLFENLGVPREPLLETSKMSFYERTYVKVPEIHFIRFPCARGGSETLGFPDRCFISVQEVA
jgi:hypothetical protein